MLWLVNHSDNDPNVDIVRLGTLRELNVQSLCRALVHGRERFTNAISDELGCGSHAIENSLTDIRNISIASSHVERG